VQQGQRIVSGLIAIPADGSASTQNKRNIDRDGRIRNTPPGECEKNKVESESWESTQRRKSRGRASGGEKCSYQAGAG